MTCPKCGGKTRVLDLVHTDDNETYRKKRCQSCEHEFFTMEFEVEANANVSKEWGLYHRKEYPTRSDKSQYQPKNYIPGSARKYERYTEADHQYIREHRFESARDIAKHIGKNLETVKTYVSKYRKELRNAET